MNQGRFGQRPFHRDTTQEAKSLTPLEQRALGLFVGDEQHTSSTARPYLRVIEGGRTKRAGTKVNGLALTEKDEAVWQTLRQLFATSGVAITPTALGMSMGQSYYTAPSYVSESLQKLAEMGKARRINDGTYVPNVDSQ